MIIPNLPFAFQNVQHFWKSKSLLLLFQKVRVLIKMYHVFFKYFIFFECSYLFQNLLYIYFPKRFSKNFVFYEVFYLFLKILITIEINTPLSVVKRCFSHNFYFNDACSFQYFRKNVYNSYLKKRIFQILSLAFQKKSYILYF